MDKDASSKADELSVTPGSLTGKERTNSDKLSPDLHVYICHSAKLCTRIYTQSE